MYAVVYHKQAIKDIQKLKASKLDGKAMALIEVLRQNPYQSPPPFEKARRRFAGSLLPPD